MQRGDGFSPPLAKMEGSEARKTTSCYPADRSTRVVLSVPGNRIDCAAKPRVPLRTVFRAVKAARN